MRIQKILIITLFLLSTLLYANSESIIQNLLNRYTRINSFEADLTQTNWFSDHDITLTSTGRIYIQGNTVVVEYIEPVYQFIKSEPNKSIIYSRDQNTAIISSDDIHAVHLIFHFSNLLSKDINLISITKTNAIFSVDIPLDEMTDITLHIDIENNTIDKIQYEDDMNNTVLIEFTNQIFNRILSRDINEFVIPDGTTIIYN